MRHVSIALGSLAELETQMHIAKDLGYAHKDSIGEFLSQTDRLGKQLRSLTKSLQTKLNSDG
jgi:four helix bundle protein